MYHLLEALARWMTPILSFTAEEIWRSMPGSRGECVLLETWYALPEDSAPDELASEAYWEKLLAVREQVARELEKARVAGAIGSSLEAEVDLYADADLRALLAKLSDELRFVFITSEARVQDLAAHPAAGVETALKGLRVAVSASGHAKCGRCWHRRADVGSNAMHPQLCGRCVTNVMGAGELRRYA
jgi:isoleucyl-tRNA synthetase